MDVKLQNKAYILLGSNSGDRFFFLEQACKLLSKGVGSILKQSAIYETAAWGITEQAAFLNQVLFIESALGAEDLLTQILAIEEEMGRVRFQKWGERIIDIDILYFNDEMVELPNLIIPHPFIQDRRFTLVPLCEIAPDYLHPKFQKSNQVLLEECPDLLAVRQIGKTSLSKAKRL